MARAALGLSIFAFIPPLGIAAIVLGHMAEARMASTAGDIDGKTINGTTTARAALWIAYLQLALLVVTAGFILGLFHETAQGFRQDALVQRVFRASDQMKPLDPESAREAEGSAQTLIYQFVAIEDEIRRHRENGSYACQINELTDTGVEGATDAEKRAFAVRVLQSPYLFQLSDCNPNTNGSESAAYVLTAVPRPPRMPDDSAVFCTDQTGVVRTVRGGISLDCLKNGQPAR